MIYIPRIQPKRKKHQKLTKEEKIKKLHIKANALMDESGIIERDMIRLEKEIGKTRPNTKKISMLRTRYNKKKNKYYSLRRKITDVLYKKDTLLGYTTKKGYQKPFA